MCEVDRQVTLNNNIDAVPMIYLFDPKSAPLHQFLKGYIHGKYPVRSHVRVS